MAYTITTNPSTLINSTDFTGNGTIAGTGGSINERGFLYLEDASTTPIRPVLFDFEGYVLSPWSQ